MILNWWKLWPSYFLCLMPWLFALVPNVTFRNGREIGAGLFRQWLSNLTIDFLPAASAQVFVNDFQAADLVGEYIQAIPGLLLLTMVLLWGCYLFGSMTIAVNNWAVKGSQRSVRVKLKG